jgi:hypothetical protein
MITTQEPEVNFNNQIDDLIRCFKYLSLYSKSSTERAYVVLKVKSDHSDPANSVTTQQGVYLNREMHVVPDAQFATIRHGLRLAPAILRVKFCDDATISESTDLPFDSQVIDKIVNTFGHGNLREQLLAWYVHKSAVFSADASDKAGLINVRINLDWQVYCPLKPDLDKDILYIHFTKTDEWLAMRFSSLSENSDSIQIMNMNQVYIIDCEHLKYNFSLDSESFIDNEDAAELMDQDTELNETSFFNLEEVTDAFDRTVDTFKENRDDPYLDPDSLEDEQVHFLCGSESGLEQLITLICHASIPMQAWENSDSIDVDVRTALDDGDDAYIDYDQMGYEGWDAIKEHLSEDKFKLIEDAFTTALSENQPCGHTWEYNDGPYDRQSGYDRNTQLLTIKVTAPSAHEQICAKMEIKKLVNKFGKATIEGLLK